mmetsp:Transcript_7802/g.13051  ORF Transcript_7802/g.13051 Transcript_7802/m.13051 type:complete len:288 (-) Transcript_7802:65-928(-)
MSNQKTLPLASRELSATPTPPPRARAFCSTECRPRPVPPAPRCSCEYGRKSRRFCSSPIPMPVSATSKRSMVLVLTGGAAARSLLPPSPFFLVSFPSGTSPTRTTIRPVWVNFWALLRKLMSISQTQSRSVTTRGATSGATSKYIGVSAPYPIMIRRHLVSTSSRTSRGRRCGRSACPDSSLATSRPLLRVIVISSTAHSCVARMSSCSGVSGVARSIWLPRLKVASGVPRSCATWAIHCVWSCFAAVHTFCSTIWPFDINTNRLMRPSSSRYVSPSNPKLHREKKT